MSGYFIVIIEKFSHNDDIKIPLIMALTAMTLFLLISTTMEPYCTLKVIGLTNIVSITKLNQRIYLRVHPNKILSPLRTYTSPQNVGIETVRVLKLSWPPSVNTRFHLKPPDTQKQLGGKWLATNKDS